jgi:hypothetical protein
VSNNKDNLDSTSKVAQQKYKINLKKLVLHNIFADRGGKSFHF